MKLKNVLITIASAFISADIVLFLFVSRVSIPQAQASECKSVNAECQINNSDKSCCPNLHCVPFNWESGNGKCEPNPTSTPIVKPTNTPEPTVTPTPCPIWEDGKKVGEFGSDFQTGCGSKPTSTPTIKPSPTPSLHPTSIPCGDDCDVTPTPTVTVAPPSNPGGPGDGQHSPGRGDPQTGAIVCNGEMPTEAYGLYGESISGGFRLFWHVGTDGTKQTLFYGPTQNTSMEFGYPTDLRSQINNVDILVKGWSHIFFVVKTFRRDCTKDSIIGDP